MFFTHLYNKQTSVLISLFQDQAFYVLSFLLFICFLFYLCLLVIILFVIFQSLYIFLYSFSYIYITLVVR